MRPLLLAAGAVLAIAVSSLAFALQASADVPAAIGPRALAGDAATAPSDRAATHAFLEAVRRLVSATVVRFPAALAAKVRVFEALGRECKGVLRGAPGGFTAEAEGSVASPPKISARAQGEQARSGRERATIELEVYRMTNDAVYRVLRVPYEAFVAAVSRLTWSNPTIDALVRQAAERLREDIARPPVSACADMRAWVASGYQVLPPGSKAFRESMKAQEEQTTQGDLEPLLRPYEGPAERAIIRRTDALENALRKKPGEVEGANRRLSRAEYRMELAFGEKPSPFLESEFAPVVGRGRTSAGTTFVIRRDVAGSRSSACARDVQVEVKNDFYGSHGDSLCLDKGTYSHPTGRCSGTVETVELATPANVRKVRVRLSNGRTVVVSVVPVPAKDGGPAGVFVDAFRGYRNHPVFLQELDRDGRVRRTVGLGGVRCKERGRPQFLDLATVTTPSGEPLTITGTLLRLQGHTEFSLSEQPGVRQSESHAGPGAAKQFQWHLSTECAPHPYTLLDGILAPPGASVLVRTPAGLSPLARVELPDSVPSQGALFYGVYATPPTEIVVETSNGSILYSESLAATATEETEFCEGYAER